MANPGGKAKKRARNGSDTARSNGGRVILRVSSFAVGDRDRYGMLPRTGGQPELVKRSTPAQLFNAIRSASRAAHLAYRDATAPIEVDVAESRKGTVTLADAAKRIEALRERAQIRIAAERDLRWALARIQVLACELASRLVPAGCELQIVYDDDETPRIYEEEGQGPGAKGQVAGQPPTIAGGL